MSFNPQDFYGLWFMNTGPSMVELLLHDDGSYGAWIWGGAQHHWGRWELENQPNQTYFVLHVQGAIPQQIMAPVGGQPVNEKHAVIDVQPNYITLFDAYMSRQYVPATPMQPLPYRRMPILPPSPAYSAPPPPPQPAAQFTPVSDHWDALNTRLMGSVQTANANVYPQTPDEVRAARENDEFWERQKRIQDQFNIMFERDKVLIDRARFENDIKTLQFSLGGH